MAQPLMTPGVYIEEKNAFPGSVVEVATAIPAFIGYTEKASRNGKSLLNIPTRITSFAEYVELFGGGFSPKFKVDKKVGSSVPGEVQTVFTAEEEKIITERKEESTKGLDASIPKATKDELEQAAAKLAKEEIFNARKRDAIINANSDELKRKNLAIVLKDKIKKQILANDPNSTFEEVAPPESTKTLISSDTIDAIFESVLKVIDEKGIEDVKLGEKINTAITQKLAGEPKKEIVDVVPIIPESNSHSFKIGKDDYTIEPLDNHNLLFYNSIKLFYSNGGGTCYIVSVGTYEGLSGITIDQKALLGEKKENNKEVEGGLKKLKKEQEPTLVVIPEAVLLGANCYEVYKQVLIHCGEMQNRFAIFDLHDGNSDIDETNVSRFREGIGSDFLSYGAVYYPWLNTNIVEKGEVTFKNLDMDFEKLKKTFLEPKAVEFFKEAKSLPPSDKSGKENAYRSSKNLDGNAVVGELDLEIFINNIENNFHMGLVATSPSYSSLLDEVRNMINQMPAAPAMAGKYTAVDNSRGVWKAPANVSLNSVVKPMVNITHDDQQNLNVDAVSGKSINAIRTFPGVGTLVWGARTLNGNSLDWQYINVRRTIIMLEQSIKLALRSYVFEPNDANTWITVKSMIVNFLSEKWKQGALAGSSPEDAFDVQIGLGATMTGLDILQGKMLVSVKLAIVRPAEFIVVTFQQQMQKS